MQQAALLLVAEVVRDGFIPELADQIDRNDEQEQRQHAPCRDGKRRSIIFSHDGLAFQCAPDERVTTTGCVLWLLKGKTSACRTSITHAILSKMDLYNAEGTQENEWVRA